VIYGFEDYELDTEQRELRCAGHVVSVEPQIFDLLQYLIGNRERVVSRDDLIAGVWKGRIVSEATLSSRINAVRSAIGDNGRSQRLIKTLSKKGIRFVGAVSVQEPSDRVQSTWSVASSGKPSIAILPFANLGGKSNQDYLCDGIVEDITIELSRFSELFVIARNSSFQYKQRSVDVRQVGRELGARYVLEGSIRRVGGRVRIGVQLSDAETGMHRWAERFDRKLTDVFAVQDEVARRIVAILVAHVNKAESSRALLKPTKTWRAYDFYLRGAETFNAFYLSYKSADLYETRRLVQQAIAADASYGRAYGLLGDTYLTTYMFPLNSDYINPRTLDRAFELARRAVELDPLSPAAHALLGFALGFRRQHDASLDELARATALNPNYTDWRYALTFVMAGEHTRAVAAACAHLRADPFYPPRAALWLGVAYFMLKRYQEGLRCLRKVLSRAPKSLGAHAWAAATYAQMGQLEDARREVAELLQIDPSYTVEVQRRLASFCKRQQDIDHFLNALRKAGLPEK
jgi:adenylate cyclase